MGADLAGTTVGLHSGVGRGQGASSDAMTNTGLAYHSGRMDPGKILTAPGRRALDGWSGMPSVREAVRSTAPNRSGDMTGKADLAIVEIKVRTTVSMIVEQKVHEAAIQVAMTLIGEVIPGMAADRGCGPASVPAMRRLRAVRRTGRPRVFRVPDRYPGQSRLERHRLQGSAVRGLSDPSVPPGANPRAGRGLRGTAPNLRRLQRITRMRSQSIWSGPISILR